MDLRVSDIVFGKSKDEKYEITKLIDSGGFGVVYEIRNEDGDVLALKTIITALLNDAGLQALTNEGRLATEILHENVLQVIYFHDGQQFSELPPYMLMEYADGGTLNTLLNERRSRKEFFDSSELRDIFIQLASGMKAINEKLVHRDIKPDNILIVKGILKISDFGLSKVVGAATRSRTFKGINHVMYCAPEAWRLDKNLPSMDMYSMGITFYEIATLHHPYIVEEKGDFVEAWKTAHFSKLPKDPNQYNPSLESKLAQIIMKMMSKRPEDRYASWDDVLQRLQISEIKESQKRNVSPLVERALASHRSAEQARLEAEARREKEKEQSDIVSYCFTEILEGARETIDAFNNQSEFLKLKIQEASSMGFSIYADKGVGALPTVSARVTLAGDVRIGDGQIVKAWGWVKAPSGRGFNLLLLSRGKDDLYGRWQTLHVTHNPVVVREDRPEPFPFELSELPKEIHLLNAFHIYQTTKKGFQADMFDPLIEELL